MEIYLCRAGKLCGWRNIICDNRVIQRADNTVRVDEVIYRADNLCGWSNIQSRKLCVDGVIFM
jgi:hypothetical protein